MKSNLWAMFGFIMIVVMVLSAGFVIINEFNLIAGSNGVYLNPSSHLNSLRVFLLATIGFALAIINIMTADKK